jgi:glycosyltransferase involved in cell wall biosynthesis
VVAAVQKRNGVTKGAQLQVEALRRQGVDVELLDATPALRNPFFRIEHDQATAYIFHSGGPQIASMLSSVMPQAAQAWRVAYWAWELPSPPRQWPDPKGLVSEIWTPSEFAHKSLALRFDVPISVVPHAVLPSHSRRQRAPEQPFTVLTMADSRSSLQRKNPAGAIRAFARAFGGTAKARLIVKLSGAASSNDILPGGVGGDCRVEVIDSYLDDSALAGLYRSADVLLSLHRAEGFGLPMLEAMAMGVPVVATGWSGNLDFMSSQNAMLVPAREVPVEDDAVYFRYGHAVWAEPDEAAAAAALRRLYEDAGFYSTISEAAYAAAVQFARDWRLPQ